MNMSNEVETEFSGDVVTPVLEASRRWDERVARLVSDILSPPLLAVAGLALATRLFDSTGDYLWLVYYLFLVIVIPMAYLLWKLYTGEISDFHVRVREQRMRPMLVSLFCALIGWISLWLGDGPRGLMIIAGLGMIQMALILLVTSRWKISGHGVAIGGITVFAVGIFGREAWPLLLAIPLVAWARVRLKRHTLAQTVAGSLLGIAMTLLLLQLL